VGVGVGLGVGVAVGEAVGVGTGVGVGVGVGEVKAFPSKLPGFVSSGDVGVEVVAFELNTIHRPSVLIMGRLFAIRIRTFVNVDGGVLESNVTLFVSVIWKIRRWAKSKRKISVLPSSFRGFSVARFPFDSNTTNRPSPLMLPAKDSTFELVICPITEST
jgi:hypothetical protein